MKSFLTFIFIIAILVVGVLGYFGLVPFVSDLMGSTKPKDLGMVFSESSYKSAKVKSKIVAKKVEDNTAPVISYEGSHEVNTTFTQEEISSSAYIKEWAGYPISEVQIRINDDNTCEMSGMVDLTSVEMLLSAFNISQGDYKKALESVHIPLKKMPFYAKGSGAIMDNQVEATLTSFEVGRFPVPASLISKYNPAIMSFGETIIRKIPGLNIKEAKFENNSIHFEGSLPDAEITRQ